MTYEFYLHHKNGNLEHLKTVEAKEKKGAIRKMGYTLPIRMRKGEKILCIPTSRLGELDWDDLNGVRSA